MRVSLNFKQLIAQSGYNMKVVLDLTINLPRETVVSCYCKLANRRKWQKNLIECTVVEGQEGSLGSRNKLVFKQGRKRTELFETVSVCNLPEEFSTTYAMKGMRNIMRNYFREVDADSTHWIAECEFKGNGIIMKSMLALMPKAFERQVRNNMDSFKNYIEQLPAI